MSRSLRYQQPEVREHLASQYALGTLTPLVRRRVDALMIDDIELQREVAAWQKRLSPMNSLVAPIAPPDKVKNAIMARISGEEVEQKHSWFDIAHWIQSVFAWRITTAFMAAVFVLTLVFNTSTDVNNSASYLAMMSMEGVQGEAPLVISGYAKTKDQPSKLKFNWNERLAKVDLTDTTLWAIDRETGAEMLLGSIENNVTEWSLNKTQWVAVKGSLELIVKRADTTVLRGLCLQLEPWAIS